MWNDAWTVARKDLRLFFRDRTAVALGLLLPILLATIFGSAMGAMSGGGGGGMQRVDLAVEDLDGSQASAAFVARLRGVEAFDVSIAEDARREVKGGEVPAAIVIPAGYGERLAAGELPEVLLLRDPSRSIAQQVIAGNLMPVLCASVLEDGGQGLMPRVLEMLDFPAAGMDRARAALEGSWTELDVVVAELTEEGAFDEGEEEQEPGDGDADQTFNFMEDVPAMLGVVAEDVAGQRETGMSPAAGASHAVGAMAVMMLMFSLVAAGGTLLEERDAGTLLRLQLAPAAGTAILLGKLISMGAVGLLQLLLLFGYGRVMFDVPIFDDPLALGLTAVGVVFAATGLGMLFATLCTSRKQLEGLSTLVILVMSAVGGAWFPREITPEWFRFAGQFTITAYAMDAFHGVLWYGKGLLPTEELAGVWRDVAVLYGIGVAIMWGSFRLYRRRFVDMA